MDLYKESPTVCLHLTVVVTLSLLLQSGASDRVNPPGLHGSTTAYNEIIYFLQHSRDTQNSHRSVDGIWFLLKPDQSRCPHICL